MNQNKITRFNIFLFMSLNILLYTNIKCQVKFILTTSEMPNYILDRQIEFGWEISEEKVNEVIQQKWKKNNEFEFLIEYCEFNDAALAIQGTGYAATKSYATPFIFGSFNGSIIKDASWVTFGNSFKHLFFVRGNVGIKIDLPKIISEAEEQNIIIKLLDKIESNLSSKIIEYEESLKTKQFPFENYQKITEPLLNSSILNGFAKYSSWDSKWLIDSSNILLGLRNEWKNQNGSILGIDICQTENEINTDNINSLRGQNCYYFDVSFQLKDNDSLEKIIDNWKVYGNKNNISIIGYMKNMTVHLYQFDTLEINIENFKSVLENLTEQVSNFLITSVVENEGQAIEVKKETFFLNQNYPNPFNNSTIIGYDINKSSHVSLKIFDLAGREIVALVNDNKPQGFYQVTWNGMNENGKQMASGTYIFTLKTEHLLITKRMILLK